MKADLHIHSTQSDGSFTRQEILEKAKQCGITHLSFTDHDTTKNAHDAVLLGKEYGITVIPGIEISAYDYETRKKVHILGYNYQTTLHLEELCAPTLQKRHNNCLKQIHILQSLGYQITPKDVLPYTEGTIYKQHILTYLVDSGQSEDIFANVYHTIFKNGGPCDFDISYVAAQDAVKAICADQGIAVLAHPGQQDNYEIVKQLVPLGLQGIERNHPSHSSKDHALVDQLCTKYSLFETGGSDFHGKYEKTPSQLGGFVVPKPLNFLKAK